MDENHLLFFPEAGADGLPKLINKAPARQRKLIEEHIRGVFAEDRKASLFDQWLTNVINDPTPIKLASIPDLPKNIQLNQTEIESVVSRLPEKILFRQFNPNIERLLSFLVENGCGKEIISRFPKKILATDLSDEVSSFLYLLAENGLAEDLILKLPANIDEFLATENSVRFLVALLSFSPAKDFFFDKIQSLDLNSLANGISALLFSCQSEKLPEFIFSKILTPINLASLSEGGCQLLVFLLNHNYIDQVFALFPSEIDLSNISEASARLLTAIINQGLIAKLVNHLPKNFDVLQVPTHVGELLAELAEWKTASEENLDQPCFDSVDYLLAKVPLSIDLSIVSLGGKKLLSQLLKLDQGVALLARISSPINLATLSDGGSFFLSSLIKKGFANEVLKKFPDQIDLNSLTAPFVWFSTDLIRLNDPQIDNLLVSKIPAVIDIFNVSEAGLDFLVDLCLFRNKSNAFREVKQKIEQQLGSLEDLRPVIRLTENDQITGKVGPTVDEIIQNFPLDHSSHEKVLGWDVYSLIKEGSVSKLYIRINKKDPNQTKVILRTKKFSEESLAAYKQAIGVLPTGVTRAFYPELLDDDSQIELDHFHGDGYREVFAGPNLLQIKRHLLPESIKISISRQIIHIKLALAVNGIVHKHDHFENFNVRFLLTTHTNDKKIYFDINEAIRVAIANDWGITPIVTLRDWDMSESK